MTLRIRARARRLALLACLVSCAFSSLAHANDKLAQRLIAIQGDLDHLDLESAERHIAALNTDPALRPAELYYGGVLAFHRGQYAQAQHDIDAALQGAPASAVPNTWVEMQALAAATQALVSSLSVVESADHRYRVHVAAEDALLAPYALSILKAADTALTELLGIRVPGPIRLEVYPSAASLAKVSPLTEAQIETSGTIALCKWNRLMITTPRALARGYPWADTIAHELTHLFLSTLTHERAPVWLQEGIAKLMERRWRGAADASIPIDRNASTLLLDSASQTLLLDAAKNKKLLPFERLHPSIAMLPSQQDAALAFAQVSTFMDRFVKAYGPSGLRTALQAVAEGTDAREALGHVAQTSFATMEREWSQELTTRARTQVPRRVRALPRRLLHGGESADELSEVEQEAARKFLRLGDMLWSRGRSGAAAIEYGKAHRVAPEDPIVASRYGRSALQAGDAQSARNAMQALLTLHPEHAPALSVLASASWSLGEHEAATRAAMDAILLNPFDPDPHCVLARAGVPDPQRESRLCASLR